jgi:transcriptional regulator with XRE-family HTH domain
MSTEEPSSKIVKTLVSLFQTIRTSQNLTLESAADLAHIHRTHLGLVERGERQPTISVATQIATALGYQLSELLAKSELIESGRLKLEDALKSAMVREEKPQCLRNVKALKIYTGLTTEMLLSAIHNCYKTLDTIDAELIANNALPVANLVELANLSSMVGNLLGASLAETSDGLYRRNKPHTYPDLLPLRKEGKDLELKMALETNRPKGHLPKPGSYITFRYVLGNSKGRFNRGKEKRGDTVWIWEVKVGILKDSDFDVSNTSGDSGKTATIKTQTFNKMALVYFDRDMCPFAMRKDTYPGLN